jgi:hypothetical protein
LTGNLFGRDSCFSKLGAVLWLWINPDQAFGQNRIMAE